MRVVHRVCKQCRAEFDYTLTVGGVQLYCNDCGTTQARVKRYKDKHPRQPKLRDCELCGNTFAVSRADKYCSTKCRDKAGFIKDTYKLSPAGFLRMTRDAAGRCNICTADGEKLTIDHDHFTGAVRGLLCRRCQLWLGHYEKLTCDVTEKMEAYLLRSKDVNYI